MQKAMNVVKTFLLCFPHPVIIFGQSFDRNSAVLTSKGVFTLFHANFSDTESMLVLSSTFLCLSQTYRVVFKLFHRNAKKKNVVQPTRIFCTSRISWNRMSDWLPIVFSFWYWKLGGTVKKTPCMYTPEICQFRNTTSVLSIKPCKRTPKSALICNKIA